MYCHVSETSTKEASEKLDKIITAKAKLAGLLSSLSTKVSFNYLFVTMFIPIHVFIQNKLQSK